MREYRTRDYSCLKSCIFQFLPDDEKKMEIFKRLLCGWRLNTINLRQFAHSWLTLQNSTYPLRNEWLSSGSNLCVSLYNIPTRKVSMDQIEQIMLQLLVNSMRGSCKESLLIISNATQCYIKQCRIIMISKLFIAIFKHWFKLLKDGIDHN